MKGFRRVINESGGSENHKKGISVFIGIDIIDENFCKIGWKKKKDNQRGTDK